MRTVRVCHASDWHGVAVSRLPWADVYVFSGDVLPNFVHVLFREWDETSGRYVQKSWQSNLHLVGQTTTRPDGIMTGRRIDRADEERLQKRWIEHQGSWREDLGIPSEAPVVVCRGNHDFTDLAPLFAGGPVFEVTDDPTRTFETHGLVFGGARGIAGIIGEWSDELDPTEADLRFSRLPGDLDVLVTHSPQRGVLDRADGTNYGLTSLGDYVDRRQDFDWESGTTRKPLLAHLHGHVHECGRHVVSYRGVRVSNAATSYNVLDLQAD